LALALSLFSGCASSSSESRQVLDSAVRESHPPEASRFLSFDALARSRLEGLWFVFVSGYRHEAAMVGKQVGLGRYELWRDGTVRCQYVYYDRLRTPGPASIQETAVPHNEMLLPNAEHVPYYDSGCIPGNFRLSVAANAVEHVGSWSFNKGVLRVRVGVLV